MAEKYHINKNGKPAICKAKTGNCPLGGNDTHFKTKEAAQKYVDKKGKEEHGLLPSVEDSVSKKTKVTKEAKPSREDKVKECFDRIEQGVKDVFTSDNYKNYLKAVSKFHRYSYNNVLLIVSQMPNASAVAGYKKWANDFNRNVIKGEKGIMILAPSQYDRKEYFEKRDANGKLVINSKTGKPETEMKLVPSMYFRPAYVFDVSQTDGDPMPTLVDDLQGTSEEAKALISSIQNVSDYEFSFVDAEDDKLLKSGAKGYCNTVDKKIVINKGLSDTQQAKTIIHEFAHAELHENSTASREQKEVEAESVAYALSNHFGLDTSDYSFPYIANWSGKDSNQLKDVLKGIQTKTSDFIDKIEPAFLGSLKK